MRKIFASLLVLALCAPAMAATISIADNADLTATVTIDATADGVNIVGLGLDVDVDGGATVTAVSVDTPNFNINPDAAYSEELGDGYVYGEGTPVAAKLVAGEIALPQSSFALSFANLNGEATAGADGAISVQVTITVSAACNLTVCENATRGGIVAVDGTALDAACAGPTAITGAECVKDTAPFYTAWVGGGTMPWSKPDCWCYQRQCRGDTDGIKVGLFWVQANDLTTFSQAFSKGDAKLNQTTICADLDHKKVGLFRCQADDLTIFANYFSKGELKVPVCPIDWDGDGDDDYNFWKN